ncbi:MAG: hypothetical protein ACOYD0_12140 [Candidatus Nanopelagicales bacterium]
MTTAVADSSPMNGRVLPIPTDPPGIAMIAVGTSCVVLGGLVAAVTGPLGLGKGSWLSAYLVLVCGVSQLAMGVMGARVGGRQLSRRLGWTQFTTYNLANVTVIAGTLVGGLPFLIDAASVLLVVALGIALNRSGTRSRSAEAAVTEAVSTSGRAVMWGYRGLLVVLLVSIPVGMLLSHLRNS